VRTFFGTVPLSALALAVSIVLAVALSSRAAAWLETRRSVAALVVLGFGLVISATLVPTGAALEGVPSDGVCDTSRVGFASIEQLTSVNTSSLNVLLFMPLGFAVGLLPWSRPAAIVALAAASLTFVVEAIQLLLPLLGRGCQTADMVDNLMGLAIGLVMGLLARPLLART
jgi:glycopeptide antibiotics resistance protein